MEDIDLEVVVPEPEDTITDIQVDEDVIDPGQFEGEQKSKSVTAPKANGPKPGHPRYEKIYGQLKEAERTIEDIRTHGMEHDPVFQQLLEDNKKLLSAMREQTSVIKESVAKDSGPSELDKIDQKIAQLKEDRKRANTEYDTDTADNITDQIYDLKRQREQVASKSAEKQPEINHDIADAVAEFTAASPWYDNTSDHYDDIMASAAQVLESKLANDPKWSKVPVIDRLAEVQRRIEARFRWQLDEDDEPEWLLEERAKMKEDKNPAHTHSSKPSVESGMGRSRPKSGTPGTVTLTAQQVKVAQKMGLTPQEYAEGMRMGGQI